MLLGLCIGARYAIVFNNIECWSLKPEAFQNLKIMTIG